MSLIRHYKLDDNTRDHIGGVNGTASANVVWTDGIIDRCAVFNGINTLVSMTTIFPLNNFSVSIWFKSYGTTPTTGTTPALFGFTYGMVCSVIADRVIFYLDNGTAFTVITSPTTYDFYNDNSWHHLVCTVTPTQRNLYIDGINKGTLNDAWAGNTRWPTNSFNIGRNNNNSMYYFRGLMDDLRFYDTALSADEVLTLYQRRLYLDSNGNLTNPNSHFCEIGHLPLKLNYTTWVAGTTGSSTGFNQNGSTSENYRVLGNDPWGKETVLWECATDVASDADGGWDTSSFTIDRTKTYRFSTWVKRNNNVNGRFYLGTNGSGSVNGVYNRSTGANDTNPYFWSDITSFTSDLWYLVVGHVWPASSGTGATHVDSGRYTVSGRKIGNIGYDFVWRAETTTSYHRSYLYYGTNVNQRQWWCYPRVDICDGTEPSISELLAGFDSNYIDYIRSKGGTSRINLNINEYIIYTGRMIESPSSPVKMRLTANDVTVSGEFKEI